MTAERSAVEIKLLQDKVCAYCFYTYCNFKFECFSLNLKLHVCTSGDVDKFNNNIFLQLHVQCTVEPLITVNSIIQFTWSHVGGMVA